MPALHINRLGSLHRMFHPQSLADHMWAGPQLRAACTNDTQGWMPSYSGDIIRI